MTERFIEKVGSYNPLVAKDHPERLVLKTERIQEWLSKGAQPTDRVARFLSTQGLAQWAAGNNPTKGKPHKKAEERAAERAQKSADAEGGQGDRRRRSRARADSGAHPRAGSARRRSRSGRGRY